MSNPDGYGNRCAPDVDNRQFLKCAQDALRREIAAEKFRCSLIWWDKYFEPEIPECTYEKDKDEIYAKDENGNNYAPSWYTLNVKAMYQISDHFTVSAGLENITDQRYRMYSSGISSPGRNFVMSLKANF